MRHKNFNLKTANSTKIIIIKFQHTSSKHLNVFKRHRNLIRYRKQLKIVQKRTIIDFLRGTKKDNVIIQFDDCMKNILLTV